MARAGEIAIQTTLITIYNLYYVGGWGVDGLLNGYIFWMGMFF